MRSLGVSGNGVRKTGVRNQCPHRRCGVDSEIAYRLFSLILCSRESVEATFFVVGFGGIHAFDAQFPDLTMTLRSAIRSAGRRFGGWFVFFTLETTRTTETTTGKFENSSETGIGGFKTY